MEISKIIELLSNQDKKEYKCYNLLKFLLENNEEFKEIILKGISENEIQGFSDDLWEKIYNQNIRNIDNFDDVWRNGTNIGYCTVAAKQLSYSLDKCFICGGILPILKGTDNCPDGSHTWIELDGNIIDTSLMLIISKNYAKKIGYIEQNKCNPNTDPIYCATKEFTNDKSLKKKNTP